MEFAVLIIFLVFSATNFYALKGVPLFLPIKLFIVFNVVMCSGILMQLDFKIAADQAHALVILLASFFYFIASFYFSEKFKLNLLFKKVVFYFAERKKVDFQLSLLFFIISACLVVIYFALVGTNVFLTAITSTLSTSDVVDLRLASYSGDQYYAPGYFNQFKNILFPASFLAIALYCWKANLTKFWRIFLIVICFVPVLLGLVGTGQRGYLFSFLISVFIFLGIVGRAGSAGVRVGSREWISIFVIFFIFFSASSYLLGRSEKLAASDFAEALIVRIFHDNQFAALVGFRYIYDQDIKFGMEWGSDLLGILPGDNFKGSNLPNRIHALIYGSDRGTAPLSMWGSVYHNWGWPGVIIFPTFISWVYVRISRRFLTSRRLTILSVAGYSYVFSILSGWVASGPMQLINNGLITAVLFLLVIKYWRFRF